MDSQTLVSIFDKYSVPCSIEQANFLLSLMDLTLAANKKTNLTAIKNEDEFIEKMIIDCGIVFKADDVVNKNIIDIGSGAGFPGLVIAILYPNCHVTCLDSTAKKCQQIEYVISKLKLNNVDVINQRAEEYAKIQREVYDFAISRAVSELNILVELCAGFVKKNGYVIAMKSQKSQSELAKAKNGIKILGLQNLKTEKIALPFSNSIRHNIWLFKKTSTPKKYPREYSKITSKPL